jgi:hypothetical protein
MLKDYAELPANSRSGIPDSGTGVGGPHQRSVQGGGPSSQRILAHDHQELKSVTSSHSQAFKTRSAVRI